MGQFKIKQRQERREIIQAYLLNDSAALAEKVSELQKKDKWKNIG